MPRQDVPYGGAICRLRERIAEIFDKLGEKLHTINGVPGDGDGNVKIVSGSSAVVITNDPTQNEISVSLDNSQLPTASVASVNGQTGAVALDAGDIPTVGGSGDVQADLQDLASDISGNTAAINAEVLARQGADSTLQTNINAVSASLPAAAAAAVAADPTVAYINSELVNKVDLSDVSTVETPDTIAKRNGSGRLVAADPVSGATDKTLVTANWISQTGDSGPNNVLHKNGQETITDVKTADDHFNFMASPNILPAKTERVTGTGWVKMYESPSGNHMLAMFAVMPRRSASTPGYGILMTGIHQSVAAQKVCKWMVNNIVAGYQNGIMISVDTDSIVTVWARNISSTDNVNMRLLAETYNGDYTITTPTYKPATDKTIYTMNDDGQGNYTGYTDSNNVTHTFFQYEISS